MKSAASGLVRALVLVAGACSGQVAQPPAGTSPYIQINLPREVASEKVWIRYRLAGDELGGWVQSLPGVSSYIIGTEVGAVQLPESRRSFMLRAVRSRHSICPFRLGQPAVHLRVPAPGECLDCWQI